MRVCTRSSSLELSQVPHEKKKYWILCKITVPHSTVCTNIYNNTVFLVLYSRYTAENKNWQKSIQALYLNLTDSTIGDTVKTTAALWNAKHLNQMQICKNCCSYCGKMSWTAFAIPCAECGTVIFHSFYFQNLIIFPFICNLFSQPSIVNLNQLCIWHIFSPQKTEKSDYIQYEI